MEVKGVKGRETLAGGPVLLDQDGSFTTIEKNPLVMDVVEDCGAAQSPHSQGQQEGSSGLFSFASELPSSSPPKPFSSPGGGIGSSTSTSTSTMAPRDLQFNVGHFFGGAITSLIPKSFEDVSVVRQVPDHQEVYVDKLSEMSMIIELLSYDVSVPDSGAALFYFDDLAKCNEANETLIDSNETIKNPRLFTGISDPGLKCTKHALVGRQTVTKLSQESGTVADVVKIMLLVIRIPTVETDLLVSLNFPSAQVTQQGGMVPPASQIMLDSTPAGAIMQKVMESITIVDWSLFA